MSQVTISLPSQLPAVTKADVVSLGLIVSAILACIAWAAYERHYNIKNEEKIAKHWIFVGVTALSGAFTYLAYLLTLAQGNDAVLRGLPYVGKHIEAVVGIATSIYLLKDKAPIKWVFPFLAKWSGNTSTLPTTTVPHVESLDPTEATFSEI
jgi:uncharacterized membrane protein